MSARSFLIFSLLWATITMAFYKFLYKMYRLLGNTSACEKVPTLSRPAASLLIPFYGAIIVFDNINLKNIYTFILLTFQVCHRFQNLKGETRRFPLGYEIKKSKKNNEYYK